MSGSNINFQDRVARIHRADQQARAAAPKIEEPCVRDNLRYIVDRFRDPVIGFFAVLGTHVLADIVGDALSFGGASVLAWLATFGGAIWIAEGADAKSYGSGGLLATLVSIYLYGFPLEDVWMPKFEIQIQSVSVEETAATQ